MADRPPPSSAPPQSGVLSALAALPLRNTKVTLLLASLVLLICAFFAWDLPISTSRYKLVSADNPHQARLLNFFDRFGYPDSLVFVLRGGDAAARQRACDKLSAKLEALPELDQRVLGRLRVEQVSEVLLLTKPAALADLRKRLDASPTELIEGGVPAWVGAFDDQLNAGLDGDVEDPPSEKEAAEGMRNMAAMLRALDAQLSGGDALAELPKMGFGGEVPDGIGVDDQGYLVSADGKMHLVALFPDLPGAEGYEVKPLVEKARAARDEVDLQGVKAELTGLPALVSDELSIVRLGIFQTSAGTTVAILLLLLLAFRSFRYTILALLPLGLGIVMTLAAVRGTYGGLNLITSSFVPVLLALGIDFGVYVLSRYGELVRKGTSPREAIQWSLAKAGPGMLIGALTTVMAFLMTTTTEFTAYSQLGVITACGLLAMLTVTFLVLPALIDTAGRGKQIASPELKFMAGLPPILRKLRIVVPLGALILVGLSATRWWAIKFNPRYFDFLPEATESASGLRQIEHDKALSPVQAGGARPSIAEARVLAAKLRALPSVASVQSPSDILPELSAEDLKQLRAGFADIERQPDFTKLRERKRSAKELATKLATLIETLEEVAYAMRQSERSTADVDAVKKAAIALHKRVSALPENAPTLAATERSLADMLERAWTTARGVAERGHYLPSDLPPLFQARFSSKDGSEVALYATPAGNIWDRATAKKFASDMRSVEPEMSGMAMDIYEHIRMIQSGFTRATLYSAGLVLVVLFIGFRRWFDALMALVPILVGSAWLLGIMGTIGLDFDVANVVTLPLILGIGIDSGAHMMHRWRQSADENGGVADLDDMIRGTGAAVFLASITTASGFAALMISDYGAMKTLGLSMTLGVLMCLVGSVLVLPALLVLLRKAR